MRTAGEAQRYLLQIWYIIRVTLQPGLDVRHYPRHSRHYSNGLECLESLALMPRVQHDYVASLYFSSTLLGGTAHAGGIAMHCIDSSN